MIKRLYAYLEEYKRNIFYCVLLVIGEVLCELMLPLMMSRIVDKGIPSENLGYMALLGGLMAAVAVLAMALGVLNAKYSAEASQGFAASLRSALYHKIQTFSFANIDTFSGASLVTRMTSDITQLQNSLMMGLRILIRAPIMLVSAYIIAASINFRLSLVIVGAVFLLVIGTVSIIRVAGALFTAMQKRLDALNGTVQENLIAIRVVKAFVREGYERLKFQRVNDALVQASMKVGTITSFMMPMMMLIMGGTTVGVIWFGGGYVSAGAMGTGELMSFISYIMQILMSVMMFAMISVMITRARACGERALEVLDTVPTILDGEAIAPRRVSRGKVEFRNVSFRYQGDEQDVLSGISFTVQPGEVVGIIGGTGSGKTSLVSLIPRFYDVTEGEVLVDGVDVRAYRQKDLRDGIGMVMQKNNLFSGTIKENILWGKEDADMEEITRAARAAQAHSFVEGFPGGYETELGQGGVNVSGGQKQRLCIARAMMKNAPIMILDDSTSAVDTATEAKIRQSFREDYRDTTIFIVAQRITSVQDADKIIVLDGGEISGLGTHDELMKTNTIYQEICLSQSEGGVA